MPGPNATEKRSKTRYKLKDRAYVVFQSHPTRLGEIVDISADSLAFRYLADGQGPASGPQQVDIMLSGQGVYLKKIPVTPIADREEAVLPFATTITRIAALQFGELTEEQRRRLNHLLAAEDC